MSDELPLYHVWYQRFIALFGALILITLIAAWINDGIALPARLGVTAAFAVMVAAFVFFGQWHQIHSDTQAILYLTINLVCITVSIRLWDSSSIVLFAVYWLAFAYLYRTPATIYAVVLTISTQWAFGTFEDGFGWNQRLLIFAIVMAVVIGFSSMMASYIESFQREADINRDLYVKLEQAQASLVEREREAATESERRRLAGEIHDTIAQHFASVITNVRAAIERQPDISNDAAKHLELALNAAQQGIADSRSLLSTTQPVVIEGSTLDSVLRSVALTDHSASGPTVAFKSSGAPASIGRLRESLVVRTLQEALRNIRKHACASHVVVTLSWLDDEVLLDITDDGVGFDPDDIRPGNNGYRIGIAALTARIEEAGGTFVLDSTPGDGTSVTVAFPTGGNE